MKKVIIATLLVAGIITVGCRSRPARTIDSPVAGLPPGVSEMTPEKAWPGVAAAYSQFVDVRTPEEYAAGHAYRARNIPLDTLMANLDKLERNEPVYLICRTGNRSRTAAEMLVKAGFPQAINISGGMNEWEAAGLPVTK